MTVEYLLAQSGRGDLLIPDTEELGETPPEVQEHVEEVQEEDPTVSSAEDIDRSVPTQLPTQSMKDCAVCHTRVFHSLLANHIKRHSTPVVATIPTTTQSEENAETVDLQKYSLQKQSEYTGATSTAVVFGKEAAYLYTLDMHPELTDDPWTKFNNYRDTIKIDG
jgi:hypothetical protein